MVAGNIEDGLFPAFQKPVQRLKVLEDDDIARQDHQIAVAILGRLKVRAKFEMQIAVDDDFQCQSLPFNRTASKHMDKNAENGVDF